MDNLNQSYAHNLSLYIRLTPRVFRYQLLPYIGLSLLLLLIAPYIMGMNYLDASRTGGLIDTYTTLNGFILMIPLYNPESSLKIRDVIFTKPMPYSRLLIHRLICILVSLSILLLTYLIILKNRGCTFPFFPYYGAALSNCLFVGGLGILVYTCTNSAIISYMVGLFYYVLNFGGSAKLLGHFELFTLIKGDIATKRYLLLAGILMILISLIMASHYQPYRLRPLYRRSTTRSPIKRKS